MPVPHLAAGERPDFLLGAVPRGPAPFSSSRNVGVGGCWWGPTFLYTARWPSSPRWRCWAVESRAAANLAAAGDLEGMRWVPALTALKILEEDGPPWDYAAGHAPAGRAPSICT